MEPKNNITTIQDIASRGPQETSAINNDNYVPIKIEATNDLELSNNQDSIYRFFVASPLFAGFGDLGSPERLGFISTLNQMPPALKTYLTSSTTPETIFSTGKESNLEDGQISQLGSIIRDLIFGKLFIRDFPLVLSSRLGVADVKAGEIANKIVSRSFGPILEDIKRIQRSKFPDKISQIQKESQPAGLGQKPPEAPRMAPPPQPEQRSPLPSFGSSMPSPVRPAPSFPQAPTVKPEIRPAPLQTPPIPPRPLNAPPLQPLSGSEVKREAPPADKSLEEELEKVANVIDLRSKSGE